MFKSLTVSNPSPLNDAISVSPPNQRKATLFVFVGIEDHKVPPPILQSHKAKTNKTRLRLRQYPSPFLVLGGGAETKELLLMPINLLS